jgi:hypothetical protein
MNWMVAVLVLSTLSSCDLASNKPVKRLGTSSIASGEIASGEISPGETAGGYKGSCTIDTNADSLTGNWGTKCSEIYADKEGELLDVQKMDCTNGDEMAPLLKSKCPEDGKIAKCLMKKFIANQITTHTYFYTKSKPIIESIKAECDVQSGEFTEY